MKLLLVTKRVSSEVAASLEGLLAAIDCSLIIGFYPSMSCGSLLERESGSLTFMSLRNLPYFINIDIHICLRHMSTLSRISSEDVLSSKYRRSLPGIL